MLYDSKYVKKSQVLSYCGVCKLTADCLALILINFKVPPTPLTDNKTMSPYYV